MPIESVHAGSPPILPRRMTASAARDLYEHVARLRNEIAAEGRETFERWRPFIARTMFLPSALNMAHYLALRRRDLRDLQRELMPWGVSSLGRSESRVMPTIDGVLRALHALCGGPRLHPVERNADARAFFRGERLLRRRAASIFGAPSPRRNVRIMVTLPAEAAADAPLVSELVARGADCARVNCSHDSPDDWLGIVRNVRNAERQTGRVFRVLMDLCGPRARTAEVVTDNAARRVFAGDRILLTRGVPAALDGYPLQVRCALSEVIDQLAVGGRVLIDEGKTATFVEARVAEGVVLRVVKTPPKGGKIQAEKGLNFPGTSLRLSPLTEKDVADLPFVVQHADMVGYSFVQEPHDVDRLHQELDALGAGPGGPTIVLKIETARAVQSLPELIVRTGGRRPIAVMIARGDLAVELGYERLAEIQEEILWLCEAAHVPVIWATQVLERLVKKGTPSRAEITDAAMSVRAECVMLNKGPSIAQGVSILDDVLSRMEAHQHKKTSRMRALRAWDETSGGSASTSVSR